MLKSRQNVMAQSSFQAVLFAYGYVVRTRVLRVATSVLEALRPIHGRHRG